MCQTVATGSSLFTDADFCYFSPSTLLRYSCWCPISSCVVNADGRGECVFSTMTVFITVLCGLALAAGVIAYAMAASQLSDLHLVPHKDTSHVRDVLFGVYHASEEPHNGNGNGTAAPVASADEGTALISTSSGKKAGGKNRSETGGSYGSADS